MRKAIAIDFDGCLCTDAYPEIVRPTAPWLIPGNDGEAMGNCTALSSQYSEAPTFRGRVPNSSIQSGRL